MVGTFISMQIQHISFKMWYAVHSSVHMFCVLTGEIRQFDKEYDVLSVHERQLVSIELGIWPPWNIFGD